MNDVIGVPATIERQWSAMRARCGVDLVGGHEVTRRWLGILCRWGYNARLPLACFVRRRP